jgi:catechol 2,3-dioxygenase
VTLVVQAVGKTTKEMQERCLEGTHLYALVGPRCLLSGEPYALGPRRLRHVAIATLSAMAAALDPRVDIGHVHLKVSDIDRALDFWCGVIGFELQQRWGDQAAFVSAGGYHHHLGLNTWESKGGSPPPRGTTGLYHVAVRFPDRRNLGAALKRVLEAGVPLQGASDHGVSEAIYLADPDGNGVELYRDRPKEEWPRPDEGDAVVAMYNAPLDLHALLAEAEQEREGAPGEGLLRQRARSD